MRVAVPYEDGQVFDHYGSAGAFKLYDIKDGNITREQIEPTEGRGHYYMVQFLVSHHVDLVICKSCGKPAQAALEIAGIDLILGAEGDADAAVQDYLHAGSNTD